MATMMLPLVIISVDMGATEDVAPISETKLQLNCEDKHVCVGFYFGTITRV